MKDSMETAYHSGGNGWKSLVIERNWTAASCEIYACLCVIATRDQRIDV